MIKKNVAVGLDYVSFRVVKERWYHRLFNSFQRKTVSRSDYTGPLTRVLFDVNVAKDGGKLVVFEGKQIVPTGRITEMKEPKSTASLEISDEMPDNNLVHGGVTLTSKKTESQKMAERESSKDFTEFAEELPLNCISSKGDALYFNIPGKHTVYKVDLKGFMKHEFGEETT